MLTALLAAHGPVGRHLHQPPPRADQRAHGLERRADRRRRAGRGAVEPWPPRAAARVRAHLLRDPHRRRLPWFADVAVDVAVVEVGLGGRWDATNVADGQVAVVTNVGLDHAETIGPDPGRHRRRRRRASSSRAARWCWARPIPTLVAIFVDAGRGGDTSGSGTRTSRASQPPGPRRPGPRPASRRPRRLRRACSCPLHGAHQGDNAAVRPGRRRGVLRPPARRRGGARGAGVGRRARAGSRSSAATRWSCSTAPTTRRARTRRPRPSTRRSASCGRPHPGGRHAPGPRPRRDARGPRRAAGPAGRRLPAAVAAGPAGGRGGRRRPAPRRDDLRRESASAPEARGHAPWPWRRSRRAGARHRLALRGGRGPGRPHDSGAEQT